MSTEQKQGAAGPESPTNAGWRGETTSEGSGPGSAVEPAATGPAMHPSEATRPVGTGSSGSATHSHSSSLARQEPAAGGAPHAEHAQASDRRAAGAGQASSPSDPGFHAAVGRVQAAAGRAREHHHPSAHVAAAHQAALAPSNDLDSQAKAAQAGEMGAAQPKEFDKSAFMAAVRQAIEKATPKTLGDAAEFKKQGKADQVKGQVEGLVQTGKDQAAGDIKGASDASPDLNRASPKPVTPMPADDPPGPLPDVAASEAMPQPLPSASTDLSAGPQSLVQKMANAKVTPQQLARGNEPSFVRALDSNEKLKGHAATASQEFRAREARTLQVAKSEAHAETQRGLTAIMSSKSGAQAGVAKERDTAKGADESARAAVAKDLEGIFNATKADVDTLINGLDVKVDKAFTEGEGAARKSFEDSVESRVFAFKLERYAINPLRWGYDLVMGAPPEIQHIYQQEKATYLGRMSGPGGVIDKVADIVGAELSAAKRRIADGQAKIADAVRALPADLRQAGTEAATKIDEHFTQLVQAVDEKQNAVVDSLAQRYEAASKAVDDDVKKMEAANKGYLDEAEEAVDGAIDTIVKLKEWVEHTAQRIASSVDRILEDPISFLGKLVTAVEHGFTGFVARIDQHLEHGFKEFLFGALAEAGIKLPESFDLKGIFEMVINVLGLTYEHVKGRILLKLGPTAAKVWHLIEQGVEIVKTISEKGLAGVWELIVEKISGLGDMIIGGIKSFIVDAVVKEGIEFVVSLCTGAGAFIEAVKKLIEFVEFFIQRGKQIQATVDQILDSVESLLSGGEGGVPGKIEQTLAGAVPTVITLLADLVGLGDLGPTLQGLVKKARGLVDQAIDWLIDHIIGLAKSAWATLTQTGEDKAGSKDDPKKQDAAGKEEEEASLQVEGEMHEVIVQYEDEDLQVLVASDNPKKFNNAFTPLDAKEAAVEAQLVSFRTRIAAAKAELAKIAASPGTKDDKRPRILPIIRQLRDDGKSALSQAVAKRLELVREWFQALPPDRRRYELYEHGSQWSKTSRRLRQSDVDATVGLYILDPLKPWLADGDVGAVLDRWKAFSVMDEDAKGDDLSNLKFVPAPVIERFRAEAPSRNSKEERQQLVDDLSKLARTTSYWQTDHKEDVAKHWTKLGHNMSHESRTTYLVDTSNLQVVSQRWNSSNPERGDYSKEPSEEFRPWGYKPLIKPA